jgi:hypothetical protein
VQDVVSRDRGEPQLALCRGLCRFERLGRHDFYPRHG